MYICTLIKCLFIVFTLTENNNKRIKIKIKKRRRKFQIDFLWLTVFCLTNRLQSTTKNRTHFSRRAMGRLFLTFFVYLRYTIRMYMYRCVSYVCNGLSRRSDFRRHFFCIFFVAIFDISVFFFSWMLVCV